MKIFETFKSSKELVKEIDKYQPLLYNNVRSFCSLRATK